ncbi:protein MEMO1 [Podospora australis]|uniref:Protein MEMO1 n=1 Tax=Podospora australis TaxID=1536484 RepID=A0AAN6WTQ8_9PEZI|nr:protein MEMO1 [Podospora australis]
MVLKRKRSDSELISFSSALSSPSPSGSFNFGAIAAMDTARRGFFAPRLTNPSHLPSRTMKRFRDNRPSEEIIHQHTLYLLFSAQQHPPSHQQTHPDLQTQLQPHPQPQPQVAEVPPLFQAQRPHAQQHQRSLYSFWNIPGRPLASSAASATPSPSPSPPPQTSLIHQSPSLTCDDCGTGLAGSSSGNGGNDDAMMDVDELDCGLERYVCGFSGYNRTSPASGRKQQKTCSFRLTNVMGTRDASHAGSWYDDDDQVLSKELDEFLSRVPNTLNNSDLPVSGARVIIAPHAGYSYSGPCAAWAYKALDLKPAKRIFVLGPSHTYYLRGCALTTFSKYATPFGDLVVDQTTTNELRQTGKFSDMPTRRDVEEHSLEMHLPLLWKRLEQTFGSGSENYPPVIPILVGDGSEAEEKAFGQILSPYLKDPNTAWIVSSDFCHWGSRFSYRPHFAEGVIRDMDAPRSKGVKHEVLNVSPDFGELADGKEPAIHEVIKVLDHLAMDAVESGSHSSFYQILQDTHNTVCGRHPIGVIMAAMEAATGAELDEAKGRFKFVQYQRSNLVKKSFDFSVSYASAYAVI